jgi:4-aminobutyrate aminotransferase-like enzyme
MKQILSLNAFDRDAAAVQDAALAAQLQRRARLFGAASVLFYQQPLEFVRGQGCWLYDAQNTPYLDAYNNVPSVGHCHPQVVEAATRQLGLLNIHSRYLHALIIDYAERLLATLPPALSNVTFTCTGSESNDLALRLAAKFTGGQGVIVTEAAYHGNTQLVSQVSPSSHRRWQALPHVRAVPAPLAKPEGFCAHVSAAIEDLARNGIKLSALLADSIFSSDGVCTDPPGFLAPAIEVVHRNHALFIADEVQPGFARTGAHWWGFQRHQVQPDIVTVGKPMGNGYPIGAVVTRPEILEAYCEEVGYFNTFGGSPVAAAIGQAVLDVIEHEGLMRNAQRIGAYLRDGLQTLAGGHATIVEVRGAGLYLGVQVKSVCDDVPAARIAESIINGLRARRVLIGAAGRHGDALKLRPPLCFGTEHADMLLAAMDEVLTVVESR